MAESFGGKVAAKLGLSHGAHLFHWWLTVRKLLLSSLQSAARENRNSKGRANRWGIIDAVIHKHLLMPAYQHAKSSGAPPWRAHYLVGNKEGKAEDFYSVANNLTRGIYDGGREHRIIPWSSWVNYLMNNFRFYPEIILCVRHCAWY